MEFNLNYVLENKIGGENYALLPNELIIHPLFSQEQRVPTRFFCFLFIQLLPTNLLEEYISNTYLSKTNLNTPYLS